MRDFVAPVLLVLLAVVLWRVAPFDTPENLGHVARYYLDHGIQDNRAANIVTAVIVNYRGLDTLGEVAVLFLSVSGAVFVLRRREGIVLEPARPASEIVTTAARLLFGPIVLFGAYIFSHGHLTPGGGFQGGAIVASGVMLLLLTERDRPMPHAAMTWVETWSGFLYVVAGLVGLALAGSFLANQGVLPLGAWNTLFSSGLIPVIYVLVGFKVGAELAALLDTMVHAGEVPDAEVEEGA